MVMVVMLAFYGLLIHRVWEATSMVQVEGAKV
jgi:hypothetical protein